MSYFYDPFTRADTAYASGIGLPPGSSAAAWDDLWHDANSSDGAWRITGNKLQQQFSSGVNKASEALMRPAAETFPSQGVRLYFNLATGFYSFVALLNAVVASNAIASGIAVNVYQGVMYLDNGIGGAHLTNSGAMSGLDTTSNYCMDVQAIPGSGNTIVTAKLWNKTAGWTLAGTAAATTALAALQYANTKQTGIEWTVNSINYAKGFTSYDASVFQAGNLAGVVTNLNVALSWDDAMGGVLPYPASVLQRATTSDFASPTTIANPANNVNTLADTLPAAGTYYYRRVATDGTAGTPLTAISNVVTVAGSVSSALSMGTLSATLTAAQANMSWGAATGGNGTVAQYEVFVSTTSGFTPGSGNLVSTIANPATLNFAYAPPGKQQYYAVIRATDSLGATALSNQIAFQLLSANTIAVGTVTTTTVQFTGLGATGGTAPNANLFIYGSQTNSFTPSSGNLLSTLSPSAIIASITPANSGQWYYRMGVVDAAGVVAYSNQVNASLASPPALAMGALSVGTPTDTIIPLSWLSATNGTAPYTYEVHSDTPGLTVSSANLVATLSGSSYNLTPSTGSNYQIAVKVTDALGAIAISNIVTSARVAATGVITADTNIFLQDDTGQTFTLVLVNSIGDAWNPTTGVAEGQSSNNAGHGMAMSERTVGAGNYYTTLTGRQLPSSSQWMGNIYKGSTLTGKPYATTDDFVWDGSQIVRRTVSSSLTAIQVRQEMDSNSTRLMAILSSIGSGGSSGSASAFLQLPTSLVSASATSIRAGDVLPIRRAQLVDNSGVAINLTGCTVQYALYTRPTIDLRISLKKFQKDAEVLFAELGFVQYAWAAGDTDTPGKFDEEWTITDSSGNVFTVPGAINSLVTILGHGG